MQPQKPVSTDTIQKMAQELLGLDIDAAEQDSVVGLLNALTTDMQALRSMDVGIEEPAITYEAVVR